MTSKIGHETYNPPNPFHFIVVLAIVVMLVILGVWIYSLLDRAEAAPREDVILPVREYPDDLESIPLNYVNSVMTFCFNGRRVWVSTYGGLAIERGCE